MAELGDVSLAEKKIRFDLMEDGESTPGGGSASTHESSMKRHHTYDQLIPLSSTGERTSAYKADENRATVVSAKHANEFDAKTQRRTLAFYRRLDRGLGLVLHYSRGVMQKHMSNLGVSYGSQLQVILYVTKHEVAWQSHEMGAKRRFDMRKIPKKFPLDRVLATGALSDDPTNTRFRMTLATEVKDGDSEKQETMELVFSAETEHARMIAIRGFELLRKHHMQIIPPDGELRGLSLIHI